MEYMKQINNQVSEKSPTDIHVKLFLSNSGPRTVSMNFSFAIIFFAF